MADLEEDLNFDGDTTIEGGVKVKKEDSKLRRPDLTHLRVTYKHLSRNVYF